MTFDHTFQQHLWLKSIRKTIVFPIHVHMGPLNGLISYHTQLNGFFYHFCPLYGLCVYVICIYIHT